MFEHPSNQPRVLRTEAPLTTGDMTVQPIQRDGELDHIVEAVRPLSHRREPENLLIHGPVGTGKTLLVKHVQSELAEETRVSTAYINCWQYNTRPSLLTELLIQLGYPAPRKGKPVDELLTKLHEWLNKHYGAVVALDEFDQLRDQTQVAYDLQDASDRVERSLGLLLISNQSPKHLELDARSESRISYQPLEIEPYSESELKAILQQRVDQAFHPETVADTVVQQIAATVAASSGDCREALTLLLRAGRLAEEQNAETVTAAHVEQSMRYG